LTVQFPGSAELQLEEAVSQLDVQPHARLQASPPALNVVAERRQVRRVEVRGPVLERAQAIDLEHAVRRVQPFEQLADGIARQEVLGVEAPAQGGGGVERREPDRLEPLSPRQLSLGGPHRGR
jgi:hypothetical protein